MIFGIENAILGCSFKAQFNNIFDFSPSSAGLIFRLAYSSLNIKKYLWNRVLPLLFLLPLIDGAGNA